MFTKYQSIIVKMLEQFKHYEKIHLKNKVLQTETPSF